MSQIFDYFQQAELSLAVYADLQAGEPDPTELEIAGFSPSQAKDFSTEWLVAKQYDDPNTGVQATVFQNVDTGQTYLAIRGTELSELGDISAGFLILTGIPSEMNPQYISLKGQVQAWLADGTLKSGFTVSGHSLGGYLAAGLLADFSDDISHAYLYNSPSNNSDVSELMQEMGVYATPDAEKISSLRTDAGISPIAGLGDDFSSPIFIAIENQFLSDVTDPPVALNHSQRVFTDTLAVYAIFAELSPELTVEEISNLLKTSSYQNATTLESAVDQLVKIFIPGSENIPIEDRNALYTAINALQKDITFQQATGLVSVEVLSTMSDSTIANQAQTDIAFRYALTNLNSFAVSGDDSIYAQHNSNGELDLYDAESQTGSITEQYLQDRAYYLAQVLEVNENDAPTYLSRQFEYLHDMTTSRVLATGSVIDAMGEFPAFKHTVFGSKDADIINGSGNDDHLYGMDGADTISAGNGDDYIEGGAGNDILFGDDTVINVDFHGDDIINGGTGDDILVGGAGIDQLLGGDDDDYLDGDGYSVDGAKHANDFLDGGKGKDVLYGAGGSDSLFGGDDNDILIGDAYWKRDTSVQVFHVNR